MSFDNLSLTDEQLFAATLALAASFVVLVEKLDEARVLDVNELRRVIARSSMNGFSDVGAEMFAAICTLVAGETAPTPEGGPEQKYPEWFRGIIEGGRPPSQETE